MVFIHSSLSRTISTVEPPPTLSDASHIHKQCYKHPCCFVCSLPPLSFAHEQTTPQGQAWDEETSTEETSTEETATAESGQASRQTSSGSHHQPARQQHPQAVSRPQAVAAPAGNNTPAEDRNTPAATVPTWTSKQRKVSWATSSSVSNVSIESSTAFSLLRRHDHSFVRLDPMC